MRTRLSSSLAPLLIAAVALIGLPGSAQASTWPVPTTVDRAAIVLTTPALSVEDFETNVMVTINNTRVSNGLRPVPFFDKCTDQLSERWGNRISRTGLFEHRDQRKVIRRCSTSWAGEALIRGEQLTPESMVQAWMDSPPHRAILMSPRAKRAGIAVVEDSEGRLIGVLNLVRPN